MPLVASGVTKTLFRAGQIQRLFFHFPPFSSFPFFPFLTLLPFFFFSFSFLFLFLSFIHFFSFFLVLEVGPLKFQQENLVER